MKKNNGAPLIVARLVDERLADNTLVLVEVLGRMDIKMQQAEWRERYGVNEGWHQTHKTPGLYDKGCGCAYCLAVNYYTRVKVSAHRLQRRLDDFDYMCRPYDTSESFRHLQSLRTEWPRLRAIKEEMRKLAGL